MPVISALLARHRSWVLVAAALLGAVAAGALAPASGPREPAPVSDRIAGFVPEVIPVARAAPTVEIRVAANDAAAPKAPAAPAGATPAPAPSDAEAGADEEAAEPAAPSKPPRRKPGASVGVTIDEDTGSVTIAGANGAREYESFESFVQQAPWLAAMVFGVTAIVFLTPILIIALVIWYKMRKTRMLNETMIKLAEKGVVPPGEALEAVAGGRAAALRNGPSTAPLYEQARAVRRGIAWSDLRKGIIAGAVGLGFVFYSMLDDGTPNFLGLVLLFVGLGYIVLWYFEDRRGAPPAPAATPAPPTPPGPPAA